jgi:hypothetical protein
MFSFTQQQIAHFQAFGFVVACGLLDEQAAGAREVPSRQVAVERLRLLGVPGSEELR